MDSPEIGSRWRSKGSGRIATCIAVYAKDGRVLLRFGRGEDCAFNIARVDSDGCPRGYERAEEVEK